MCHRSMGLLVDVDGAATDPAATEAAGEQELSGAERRQWWQRVAAEQWCPIQMLSNVASVIPRASAKDCWMTRRRVAPPLVSTR